MKQKIPSVTVAISALNEEKNIGRFLQSVLMQERVGFTLDEIWIFSDGSTDQTVNIARSFRHHTVKVFAYKNRIGKSRRLNEIYAKLKSDILVQSDADVTWAHSHVLRDIIRPLVENKQVAMCGGDPRPTKPVTFTEKAVNCTFDAYHNFRNILRGGNNIFSADGRLLAYKKEFIQRVTIPPNMIANDAFTYYCCIRAGYEYRYVESAVVYFRSPQNLVDQVKQNSRFLAAPIRMMKYFPKDLVRKESHVPFFLLCKSFAIEYVKHPVLCTYIFFVNLYTRIRAKSIERTLTAKWPMAYTTKVFNN